MRTSSISLLLLLPFFGLAQIDLSRVNKLPYIAHLEFDKSVPEPIVSDDGRLLFFPPDRIVSPAEGKSTDRTFSLPTDAFTHQQPRRIYSPDLQQTVYNYEAIVTTEGGKRKRYD